MKREIDDTITTAYLETLLWSETLVTDENEEGDRLTLTWEGSDYEEGTPLDQIIDVSDVEDLAPDVWAEAKSDLEAFQGYCLDSIGIDPFAFFDASQVAHDFALSRNGHGAGFFDNTYRVTCIGPGARMPKPFDESISDDLQSAAKTFGTLGLMLWVDAEGNLKLESHG